MTNPIPADDCVQRTKREALRIPFALAVTVAAFAHLAAGGTAVAQESAADLAKKLSNPVASLISVPFQFNTDMNIGPADAGERTILNVQPVIPFSLNEKWNLITRIITPIVAVDEIFPGSGSEVGLGDMTPTLFFSPKEPTKGGLIWGVGPVFFLPTATDDLLGSDQWGVGPSALVLKQQSGWTIGALANHIERVAGDDRLEDISSSFIQPFLSKTFPSSLTVGVNTESTFNWNTDQWTVPVNLTATTITKWGGQLMQLGIGFRYYVEAPDDGPEWGIRMNVTLLYPKK